MHQAMILAQVGFVRGFSTFAVLVVAPQKASHNNSGTVLGRIMDLRQKFRKMWSPIAPLHGFAIKAEAIFPRRGIVLQETGRSLPVPWPYRLFNGGGLGLPALSSLPLEESQVCHGPFHSRRFEASSSQDLVGLRAKQRHRSNWWAQLDGGHGIGCALEDWTGHAIRFGTECSSRHAPSTTSCPQRSGCETYPAVRPPECRLSPPHDHEGIGERAGGADEGLGLGGGTIVAFGLAIAPAFFTAVPCCAT